MSVLHGIVRALPHKSVASWQEERKKRRAHLLLGNAGFSARRPRFRFRSTQKPLRRLTLAIVRYHTCRPRIEFQCNDFFFLSNARTFFALLTHDKMASFKIKPGKLALVVPMFHMSQQIASQLARLGFLSSAFPDPAPPSVHRPRTCCWTPT